MSEGEYKRDIWGDWISLCGSPFPAGYPKDARCILTRNHPGPHQCRGGLWYVDLPVSWVASLPDLPGWMTAMFENPLDRI